MVFPSRGCLTCRQRRVKCDTIQPTCGRCVKASRSCAWDPNVLAGQEGLLFKSENAFAKGQARRPRGLRSNQDEPHRSEESSSLSSSYETLAFHYWVENFVFRPDELPDVGHEYLQYVLPYWNRSLPGSSLHLALSALSLAVFGRARNVQQALEDAQRFHAQTVMSTKKDMGDVSHESIDQLLLAVMLMGTYENIMFHHKTGPTNDPSLIADDVGSQFWKDVCHHKGASGLLNTRKQPGFTPNMALDRAVRRQCIRIIILRGVTIPDWIVEGANFDLESPELELDSCMVRTANLRAMSLRVLSERNEEGSLDPHQLKLVAGEADAIDIALACWAQTLPEGWSFSTHHFPATPQSSSSDDSDQLFEGFSHVYSSHGYAAIWNRARAVRLIVNSICLRSLSELLLVASKLPHCDASDGSRLQLVTNQQNKCRENLVSLTTEICATVPSFFGLPGASISETRIVPKMAALMVWPVAVAIRTQGVPESQRVWLERRLKVAADSMGDAALQTVIEKEEFKF